MRIAVPLLAAMVLPPLGGEAAALTTRNFCDGRAFELPHYQRDLVVAIVRNRLDEPDRTIVTSAFGRCQFAEPKRWAVCGSARERSRFGSIHRTIPFFGWLDPDALGFRVVATGQAATDLCKKHVGG